MQGDEQQNGWHHLRLAHWAAPVLTPPSSAQHQLPPEKARPPGETWDPSGISNDVPGSDEGFDRR